MLLSTGLAGGTAVGDIVGVVVGARGGAGTVVVVVVERGVVVVVEGTVVASGTVVVGVEGGTVGLGAVVVGDVGVVVGGTVVVVVVEGGTVVVDAAVDVDDAAVGSIDVVVVDPVVVESEAEVSPGVGADALATPDAVSAEPARAPTDSGTTSAVLSRRRRWDTEHLQGVRRTGSGVDPAGQTGRKPRRSTAGLPPVLGSSFAGLPVSTRRMSGLSQGQGEGDG
ncbi:MAG: hypothetical protein M3Y91_02960 [Actinomycetota bacterium]|nr:hypothetical protein [Actinomycetota bacterium]